MDGERAPRLVTLRDHLSCRTLVRHKARLAKHGVGFIWNYGKRAGCRQHGVSFVPIFRMKHMKQHGRITRHASLGRPVLAGSCLLPRDRPARSAAEPAGAGFAATRFVISSGARRARFGAGRAPALLWISGTGPVWFRPGMCF